MQVSEEHSIVELVDSILINAIHKKASDVHFEPQADHGRVRLRIDGILYIEPSINRELWQNIGTRLKIMANLNIAEKRLPQDGRFTLQIPGHGQYDCHLSSCPTIFGEKFVVRILNPFNVILPLNQLGFTEEALYIFRRHISLPQGIILVTGPTGSGKTVTLYSALSLLNESNKNISTVEDPVEIHLAGVNQIEVNAKIGLSFSAILRAFLRQDPDIIMVGEIRDAETAKIAISAAHTGHLVLATLHTNSAAASLTRLLNMGIAPFNLATSLKLIVAQRLIRKLCSYCKSLQHISYNTRLHYGFSDDTIIYVATGCKNCTGGYHGRIAIFELVPIDETLGELIIGETNITAIEKRLSTLSHGKLWELALEQVRTGVTSLEEINRVMGYTEQNWIPG
jgi:type IV pilus assembly protein PilB